MFSHQYYFEKNIQFLIIFYAVKSAFEMLKGVKDIKINEYTM